MSIVVENRVNGIDVSSANDIVDFRKVKEAGFEFVYIQSSRYSRTPDLTFGRSLDAAREAGLRVGAYHFCSHDTDPAAQAEFFYRASGGLGSKSGELPPMVDWEYCTPSKYTDHPKHCVDWLVKHAKRVSDLWYPDNARMRLPRRPVVYTYPFYSQGHQPALGGTPELVEYPLAYASYKSGPDGKLVPWLPDGDNLRPLHPLPSPWMAWSLWQYSGNGGLGVPGVAGSCDRQVFNGASGDFAEFLGLDRPVHQSEFEVKE